AATVGTDSITTETDTSHLLFNVEHRRHDVSEGRVRLVVHLHLKRGVLVEPDRLLSEIEVLVSVREGSGPTIVMLSDPPGPPLQRRVVRGIDLSDDHARVCTNDAQTCPVPPRSRSVASTRGGSADRGRHHPRDRTRGSRGKGVPPGRTPRDAVRV